MTSVINYFLSKLVLVAILLHFKLHFTNYITFVIIIYCFGLIMVTIVISTSVYYKHQTANVTHYKEILNVRRDAIREHSVTYVWYRYTNREESMLAIAEYSY